MKKLLLLSLSTAYALALNVGVSILPQEQIVKKLLPSANVITLMPAGADPHTYEPKPAQMLELSKASVFLGIGVEVEEVWLKRLVENTNIKVVNIDKNIKKHSYSHIELDEHHDHHHKKEHKHDEHHKHHHDHEKEYSNEKHHDHEHKHEKHHDHHHHDHSGIDVHIWTDPIIIKELAKNTANELIKIAPNNKVEIEKNLENLNNSLDKLNLKIYDLTKDLKIKGFISSHPSWGYFAKRYNLKEFTLEFEGKEAKPSELAKIIHIAKDKKACVILRAPQFSDKLVNTLHNESGLKVELVNPLAVDFLEEILKFAKILNDNCSK